MGKKYSAYFLYVEEQREGVKAELAAEGAEVTLGSVGKRIGEKWRALSDEEKQKFKDLAAQKTEEGRQNNPEVCDRISSVSPMHELAVDLSFFHITKGTYEGLSITSGCMARGQVVPLKCTLNSSPLSPCRMRRMGRQKRPAHLQAPRSLFLCLS